MKRALILVVLVIGCAHGCQVSHGPDVPRGQPCPVVRPVRTPFIAIPARGLRQDVDVRINDFPVALFLASLVSIAGSESTFAEVHPYIARVGSNRCSVTASNEEIKPYAIVDLDDHQETLKRTLTVFAPGRASTFQWVEALPTWHWLHGKRIAATDATHEALYAAYTSLRATIEAADGGALDGPSFTTVRDDVSEYAHAYELVAGRPFPVWREFFAVAASRSKVVPDGATVMPLAERPRTTLYVFADGALAYLSMRPEGYSTELPLGITLNANSVDGPDGSNDGTFTVVPWFRLGDDGAWHVDGMVKVPSRYF